MGVTASKATPFVFARIGVELMPSARYTYAIVQTATGFTATATAATLDDDPPLDVWSVSEKGEIVSVTDDSIER